MNYTEIFEAYYNLYLLEAETPGSDDEEYIIGKRLANEAVSRWENYDGTYWNELFTTRVASGDGSGTVATNQTDYDAPEDFKEAGGFVKLVNAQKQMVKHYKIIQPQEAQFQSEQAQYCYFTGNISEGHVLHLNPAPAAPLNGLTIDYVYYKRATKFEDGDSTTEMSIPYFIVHRMLANRFRGSRNPYYTTAVSESEDALKTMLLSNNSGSWADPWKLADNSGSTWGL